jgi:hypothetical protein
MTLTYYRDLTTLEDWEKNGRGVSMQKNALSSE